MPEQPNDPPEKGEWRVVTMDGGGTLDMYFGESKELPDIDELCLRYPARQKKEAHEKDKQA